MPGCCRIEVPYDQQFTVNLRIVGLEEKEYSFILNGANAVVMSSKQIKKLSVVIAPDQKISLITKN
jgi:hypothetical protein